MKTMKWVPFYCLLTLVLASCVTDSKSDSPISGPPAGFYAYHTDLARENSESGKYKDLVVVVGEGQRLEFARATQYLPVWVTATERYPVNELFKEKDEDPNLDYTYVRLLKSTPEEIVVHRRYILDIEKIDSINKALDPTHIAGLQAAVHEVFRISPDGSVIREIKNAEGTRYEDWNNPAILTRQVLKLTNNGIEHGQVEWGEKGPIYPRPAVEGSPVKNLSNKDVLVAAWTFDEGLQPHEDHVAEQISQTECFIDGGRSLFKKGVSGTALAFDGYYTGVSLSPPPSFPDQGAMTAEAWLALDAYPYNHCAVVHQSTGFGEEGFFLGIDPYGFVIFRVNGQEVKSATKLKQAEWNHVAGIFTSGKIAVAVNGIVETTLDTEMKELSLPDTPVMIGRNNEKARCTDYVREYDQNIEYLYSIQGLIDEVRIYETALNAQQLASGYSSLKPENSKSSLAIGILPGELGRAQSFGATYQSLGFNEIWDGLWRLPGNDEIVVKFDQLPTSVIFWKGTNYAVNWVTDNNRWFADQSSEIWGPHGCSEHMADKQLRMCYARIIESSPARVMIHWRYPCVDVGYVCTDDQNWTDEYHTIYPDGTGVRKVIWKGDPEELPGFQDIQLLTNPGESAMDVVYLQALSMANRNGETADLTWSQPNIVPENPIQDADIELINTRSDYKVFLAFQGACFTPWGAEEQSRFTADPFAGPWNHWPMHLVPSDGRYAVDTDRVTHFALAANDCAPEYGSMVLYGFTDQKIDEVIPFARSWQTPPDVVGTAGAESYGYNKANKSFDFKASGGDISFIIEASEQSPVMNPCFMIHNWASESLANFSINGEIITAGPSLRQGIIRDVDGSLCLLAWTEFTGTSPVEIQIGR
jgi:hypothetical protein